MSRFMHNLVDRAFTAQPAVRPRLPSRFEPPIPMPRARESDVPEGIAERRPRTAVESPVVDFDARLASALDAIDRLARRPQPGQDPAREERSDSAATRSRLEPPAHAEPAVSRTARSVGADHSHDLERSQPSDETRDSALRAPGPVEPHEITARPAAHLADRAMAETAPPEDRATIKAPPARREKSDSLTGIPAREPQTADAEGGESDNASRAMVDAGDVVRVSEVVRVRPHDDDPSSAMPIEPSTLTGHPQDEQKLRLPDGDARDAARPSDESLQSSVVVRRAEEVSPPLVVQARALVPDVAAHTATPRNTKQDAAAETPTIHVTIGRVEIRAVSPPPAPSRTRKSPSTSLSLDTYLRQRGGGAR